MTAPARHPFVLGLTGNIACGKSTVRGILQELGAATLDADVLVHEMYIPGDPIYMRVLAAFGAGVLGLDGMIDRRLLGRKVFTDPDALRRLEEITHPAVVERQWEWVARQTAPVAVLEAVKLVESGNADRCDAFWFVTCPPDVQRTRLRMRPGMTDAETDRRLAAQPPVAEKLARATTVINNGGTVAETRAQIVAAWATLAPNR